MLSPLMQSAIIDRVKFNRSLQKFPGKLLCSMCQTSEKIRFPDWTLEMNTAGKIKTISVQNFLFGDPGSVFKWIILLSNVDTYRRKNCPVLIPGIL